MMTTLRWPRHLRSPDDSGTPPTNPTESTPTIPNDTPNPGAASAIVAAGTKSEGDVALELENKKLTTRLAELEDQNRTLSEAIKPKPAPAVAAEKKSWLEGGSFFD